MLPPAERAIAAGDLDVAADGVHRRIRQLLQQAADRVLLDGRAPVDQHQKIVLGVADAGLDGGRPARIGLPDDEDPGKAERFDDGRGPVGGPVVDDDDLQSGVVVADQRPDRAGDGGGLVADRHDHRRGAQISQRRPAEAPDAAQVQRDADRLDQQVQPGQQHGDHHQRGQHPLAQQSAFRRQPACGLDPGPVRLDATPDRDHGGRELLVRAGASVNGRVRGVVAAGFALAAALRAAVVGAFAGLRVVA